MSFIEKIRNIFHVDQWWGKALVGFLAYVLLWAMCFGSLLLVPYDSLIAFASKYRKIVPYYIFGFFPLVSFVVPYFLSKVFSAKKIVLFISHIVVIAVLILLFFISVYRISLNHSLLSNLPTF